MNDILITYQDTEENEPKLRQILRKIENEFDGYNEIVIAGDCPDWIQGIIYMGHTIVDEPKWKIKNKLSMLQAICLKSEVTQNFLWIDIDDIVTKIDASKACRMLSTSKPKGFDLITFKHTQDILQRRGFSFHNYFCNRPISLSKINLMRTFDLIDFNTAYGYCIKTLYCNFNRLKPRPQDTPLESGIYEEKSSYEKY